MYIYGIKYWICKQGVGLIHASILILVCNMHMSVFSRFHIYETSK